MDRGGLRLLCLLLLTLAVPFSGTAWCVPPTFDDSFEDVAVGSYPYASEWLALSLGKSAYVSDLAYCSPSKSFRLDSWPWSARMDYVGLDELPNQLSYQASVCVDPTYGWVGLVGFMTRNGYQAPMWNYFRVDAGYGDVSFYGENPVYLGPYAPGAWCTVRADLNYDTLTADLWVDGDLVAQDVDITPKTFTDPVMGSFVLDQWGVAAGSYLEYPYVNFSNVVYFDDVAIWESSTTLAVEVDVKPGGNPNNINLKSRGVLPLAVFSTESFDATQIDPGTVTLDGAGVATRGRNSRLMARFEDIDGDGLLDLVLQFQIQDLDPLELQDGTAVLSGTTYGGQSFQGSDQIRLVPRR